MADNSRDSALVSTDDEVHVLGQNRAGEDLVAATLLARFKDELATAESFGAESLDSLLHDFVAAEEIKIGQIIHALRVAVTGKAVGFGLFDTLAILGQESCLARIDQTLQRIAP